MSFVLSPEPTPEPAVRTDPAKLSLLRDAVTAAVQPLLPLPNGAEIDLFGLCVDLRKSLPAGLDAGDFDGNDVAPILAELLAPVGV